MHYTITKILTIRLYIHVYCICSVYNNSIHVHVINNNVRVYVLGKARKQLQVQLDYSRIFLVFLIFSTDIIAPVKYCRALLSDYYAKYSILYLYQFKLIKMRAELVKLNHCAVPFLSRAAVNLSWYDIICNLICIL